GLSEDGYLVDEADPEALGGRRGEIRIVCNDAHPERLRALRNLGPDPPRADEAEGLLEQFTPFESLLFPMAFLDGSIRVRKMPEEGDHVADREFRDADRARRGGVHDRNLSGGGLRNIDVVDADSRATHHLQLPSTGQYRLAHGGPPPDDETVVSS